MSDTIVVRSMFREYRIEFGDDAVGVVRARLDPEKTFVVCDARVHALYAEYLAPLLVPGRHMLVAPSEDSKTIDKAQEIIEAMVVTGVRRDHTAVAIGGGITQDVTAFAASILYRGINWAFIPTTLLAQTDSCLGSKTSINVKDKKNLAGNFWPPAFAIIDPRFLDTLSEDEVRSGVGEILHFLMYADSPMLVPLLTGIPGFLADRRTLRPFIDEALRIKQGVAEIDEFDQHERHKFNFGHTFGHALESTTDYAIPHGLAVTVGVDIACFVSSRLGLMPTALFERLHPLFAHNFPARRFTMDQFDRYCQYLTKDKKNIGRDVGCILAERPGALVAKRLPLDGGLRDLLREYFEGPYWR